MRNIGEEAFRELLDARGTLRPGVLALPDRATSFAVFAQRPDARLDIDAIRRHAEKFFGAKLGLTVDKSYIDDALAVDAARIVVASDDGTASGTRLCIGRRAEHADLAAAEEAERAYGATGLALLAKRCPTLWLVVPDTDEDRAALTIATILASTMLGPILSPQIGNEPSELFGVRTARLKLESRPRPYR